jgi:hypothetical protein
MSEIPSLARQGLLVIRQSFILAGKKEKRTHKAISKLEYRSGLAKRDFRKQGRH